VLADADTAHPSFVPDLPGAYAVRLVVDDGGQTSDPATVNVTAVANNSVGVSIVEPLPNAAVPGNRVLVRGTVSAPPNAGVAVNGRVALRHGSDFVVDDVRLHAGANTLTATVTAVDGATASASILVTSAAAPAVLTVSALPHGGIAPLFTTFRHVFASYATIQTLELDADGDGTVDITSFDPSSPLQFYYETPGLYRARLTVTDQASTTYVAETVVDVQDRLDMDALLQGVWSGMTTALLAGDKDAALAFVSRGAREKYGLVFDVLIPHMADILPTHSPLQPYSIGADVAEYFLTRVVDGETRIFLIGFSRGTDGVWYVDGM
jgi:hypothetical protein